MRRWFDSIRFSWAIQPVTRWLVSNKLSLEAQASPMGGSRVVLFVCLLGIDASSQSTAMVMSGRCLHFMGLLPQIRT